MISLVPISDWDKDWAGDFTVDGLDASQEAFTPTGYFGKDPQVKRTATGYPRFSVGNLPSSGKLELHTYWPMTSTLRENNQAYLFL